MAPKYIKTLQGGEEASSLSFTVRPKQEVFLKSKEADCFRSGTNNFFFKPPFKGRLLKHHIITRTPQCITIIGMHFKLQVHSDVITTDHMCHRLLHLTTTLPQISMYSNGWVISFINHVSITLRRLEFESLWLFIEDPLSSRSVCHHLLLLFPHSVKHQLRIHNIPVLYIPPTTTSTHQWLTLYSIIQIAVSMLGGDGRVSWWREAESGNGNGFGVVNKWCFSPRITNESNRSRPIGIEFPGEWTRVIVVVGGWIDGWNQGWLA